MIWNHRVLEMKVRGSSTWHRCVLEVTRKGPHKQRRRKGNIESNVDRAHRAAETAEQKEHRLSKPRTKERARRDSRAATEVVKTH